MNKNVTRGYGVLEGFLARQRARTADRLIPEDKRRGRLLDIGCGSYPYFLLSTRFREKFGIEKALPAGLSPVNKEAGVVLRAHDIVDSRELPFGDDFFDVVTMLAVFEHLERERLPGVFREIWRVLKPDGMYILTTPAAWTDRLLRIMSKARLVSPEEIMEHKGAYTPRELRNIIKDAGFSPGGMSFGYFELFMNIWGAVAKKT